MPERASKSKRDENNAKNFHQIEDIEIPFEAHGPLRKEIQAVHESEHSRIILCDEPQIIYDCDAAFDWCNGVYWYHGKFGNRNVAVKKKPKTERLEVTREVILLETIDHHDHVMRYCYHAEDINNCYIVTEFGIELQQYMDEHRSFESKQILQQLCDAVAFLHGMNILLLNINPKNVRIMEVNSLARIKLTNFESSFQLEHNEAILDGINIHRCLEFAAPEIKVVATFSSDIYSLGCLFYFVLTKGMVLVFPSSKSHNRRLDELENSNKTCEIISFVDIIRDMVKYDSKERPNISEVIIHPCFWSEHEFFELIMDVCRALENNVERNKIRKGIDQNQNQKKVIGKNWKSKIYLDSSSLMYSGNGTSICDLVKFIRNNYAHRTDETLRMTKAELMSNWVDKFPYLMIHLYKTINYFNKK